MELYSISINKEKDILAARDRARVICEELGLSVTHQLQVTTSVFELGKNILEHGDGGDVSFSLQTDDDDLKLEVVGRDHGPGISEEDIENALNVGSSKSTANRGIPAMKRLMDSIDIEAEPGIGTTIRLSKMKTKSSKSLAKNIVSFIQDKFTAKNKITLSEELRKQNMNLVQTLSLYEEKNEELQKKNKELLDLKQQLELSNTELQDRSSELQEALLSLGDRTNELEAQNRRFTAVMEQVPGGVIITDRSGGVTKSNRRLYTLFELENESVEDLQKLDWYSFLSRYKTLADEEWNKAVTGWDEQRSDVHTFMLITQTESPKNIICRIVPILDNKQKFLGRIWIFESPGVG